MSSELKPCSLCGGEAEFVDYNDHDGVWGNWSVHCPHCESDPMYKDERGDKWCVMIEVHGDSKETVKKAWNTRAERTCHVIIEDEYLVCSSCNEDIDPSWAACPYCGARAERGA